jgi:phosphate transport system substrate-binding protein
MTRSRHAPKLAACALSLALLVAAGPSLAGTVRVGGTGMGLAAMRALSARLAASDAAVELAVLPSLGTQGGLRALAAGAIDVALAARPLKPEEQASGQREVACFVTALVFATSHPSPVGITRAALPRLYAEPRPTWPDGSRLRIILRSRDGAEMPLLVARIPELGAAFEAAYHRPGLPIGTTHQENAELAETTAGSFAMMTLLQLQSEWLSLLPVTLDGVAPSRASVASGAYPLALRFCLVLPQQPVAAAARFVDFVRSEEGASLMRSFGAEPSE